MRTIKKTAATSAIFGMLLLMATATSSAQDIQYSDLINRIDSIEKDRAYLHRRIGTLEAERNVMRSQLATYGRAAQPQDAAAAAPTVTPATAGNACGGCSGGGCDAWCRPGSPCGGCGTGCDGGGCGIGCGTGCGAGCDSGGCGIGCGTGCDGGGCGIGCGAGCDGGAGCCGAGCGGGDVGCWYFGYEVTFLQPAFANFTLGPELDNRSGFGHRLIFGRERSNGVGFRTRLWMLNTGQEFVPQAPVTLSIDMDAFDFDLTLREQFCSWDLLVSGGFRYGRLQYGLGPAALYYEGTGPTFSAEGTRCIGNRGFYLVGNVRGSTLFGHIRNPSGILGAGLEIQDEVMTVFESQFGLGWRRQLRRSQLNMRFLFEAQNWSNHNLADPLVGVGSNLGLYGATLATDFRF